MPLSRLEQAIASLAPASVLDVGCGCGRHFTSTLSRLCPRVVAIDIVPNLARWPEVSRSTGVSFCAMDARSLGFPSHAFPLVIERAALHHIADWQLALAEMVRVSSDGVYLEEPVDDLRSDAKRRAFEAQSLLLELQAEVGFPHYRHLEHDALTSAVESRASLVESHLVQSDAPVTFDEFFDGFATFASRSQREGYWLDQLETLRTKFGGAPLCEDDTLTILAKVREA